MKNLKKTIQGFINSYANSALKDIIDSAIISCSAKIGYRAFNRILQTLLHKGVDLVLKNETETDIKKKEKRKIGIMAASNFFKQSGEALIAASNTLLEAIK